jgi:hypothetical protein
MFPKDLKEKMEKELKEICSRYEKEVSTIPSLIVDKIEMVAMAYFTDAGLGLAKKGINKIFNKK